MDIEGRQIQEILPDIDALKFRSSMTLFDAVCPDDIFARALDKYFDGQRDEHTLRLLSTNVSSSHV